MKELYYIGLDVHKAGARRAQTIWIDRAGGELLRVVFGATRVGRQDALRMARGAAARVLPQISPPMGDGIELSDTNSRFVLP